MLLDGRRRKRNLRGGIFLGVVVMATVRVPSMRVVVPVASATTAQPKRQRGNRENVNQFNKSLDNISSIDDFN